MRNMCLLQSPLICTELAGAMAATKKGALVRCCTSVLTSGIVVPILFTDMVRI